jgi:hypothetical protein
MQSAFVAVQKVDLWLNGYTPAGKCKMSKYSPLAAHCEWCILNAGARSPTLVLNYLHWLVVQLVGPKRGRKGGTGGKAVRLVGQKRRRTAGTAFIIKHAIPGRR